MPEDDLRGVMMRKWVKLDGDDRIEEGEYEVSWQYLREQRDQALASSDWRAVKDRVLPTAWKDYRQALRDLPQDHAESNDAADNWPVKPDD